MDIFVLLFGIPFMLIMGIPIGFFRLFTPFGILYALPLVVLFVAACLAKRMGKTKQAVLLVLSAVVGQWLSFLSWVLSRQALSPEDATRTWGYELPSIAKAGYPISAVEIPPSPMGSDTIPLEMWHGVFTNHLLWFVFAFVVSLLVLSKLSKRFSSTTILRVCIPIAFLALFYNLALFALWFD